VRIQFASLSFGSKSPSGHNFWKRLKFPLIQ
jgi:hypothetical protein